MLNGFIYVVDAQFIDKIEKRKTILDPSACDLTNNKEIYYELWDLNESLKT
jgi:hypothetical protein